VIDVEQRPLGAFEENVVAAADRLGQQGRAAADVLGNLRRVFAVFGEDLFLVEGRFAEEFLEQEVLFRQDLLQLAAEGLWLDQVTHADAAAADLVFVGRADAAPGGADLTVGYLLAGDVDGLVPRHDDVQVAVDHQLPVVLEIAALLEVDDLAEEDLRIEHHAVADDAALAGVENAGGDQVQDHLLITDHQGMTGIVPPLVADHLLGVLGVDVNDLALAFVAPLGAYNDYVCHDVYSPRRVTGGTRRPARLPDSGGFPGHRRGAAG
jgi:hypothetical protein